MKSRSIELMVGIFMISALFALMFLAFRVSEFSTVKDGAYYNVLAKFDNIGGLKVRAPVNISGVKIGEISKISLDKENFRAVVTMRISNAYKNLPLDTSANIFTQGILGSNYISLSPGFDAVSLRNNDVIETTNSALVLETLIGQLVYNLKSDGENKKKQFNEKISSNK